MDALAALSLDVAEWGLDLHPPEWDYAAHANSLAKGKRFVVNTAQLWAAVEVGQEDDQSKDGVTTRTVKNVLEILFGEPIRIDDKDNAGNKATVRFLRGDLRTAKLTDISVPHDRVLETYVA